jgi:alanine racemase
MYVPSAILSTSNLLHNLKEIKNIAKKSKVMVMLKANAYGHGIRSTAMRLDPLVDYIGVARFDEAVALRKVGVKAPICIMQGVFTKDEVIAASCSNFELLVYDFAQLDCLDITTLKKVNIWLKIDTGIGRVGFKPEQAQSVFQTLKSYPSVGVVTLASHFACADDKNHPKNQEQMQIFKKIAKDFPGPKSLANSAAIFNFPESHYDIVRPGISLYGASPFQNISAVNLNLKPVMTLISHVMSVRTMPKGSTFGYGARFQSASEISVATVGIGYGDGYPRSISDGAPVMVNNTICPIVGRISMDMMTIDITNCKSVKCGDIVTLLGQCLPLEDIIQYTANSVYDILTSIQLRVKFYWEL